MASRPDHKAFHPSRLVKSISRDRIGLDGAAGNKCYMCQESAHFLNHCPVLLEYIRAGKVIRNAQNMVMLSSGDPISSDPNKSSVGARIDEFYARNRSCLPRESTLISRRTLRPICSRSKATDQAKDDGSNLFCTLDPSMRKKNNSARSAAK